jgi:hypothetical protein
MKPTSNYIDFANSVIKNRVEMVYYQNGYSSNSTRWNGMMHHKEVPRSFFGAVKVPNFDCGFMFNSGTSEWVGDERFDSWLVAAKDAHKRGNLTLPFRRFSVLSSCVDDEFDFDRSHIIMVEQVNDEIVAQEYMNTNGKWTAEPFAAVLLPDGSVVSRDFHLVGGRAAKAHHDIKARFAIDQLLVFLHMINEPVLVERVQTQTFALKKFNSARKASPALEAPTVLSLRPNTFIEAIGRIQSGGAAPKSPHLRRGHNRVIRMKSGDTRVIQVRPCRINGGSETRNYALRA